MNRAALADPAVKRRLMRVVFLVVFMDLIGFGIVLPLLPLYVESLHGSPELVGLIFTSFSLMQLIAAPVLGRLGDRFGRRPIILVSLLGNGASMVLFAVASYRGWLWLLFASRLLAGVTAGNLSSCQAAIADVTEREERAKGMGRVGAAIGLGLVLGPVLGAALSHPGAWLPPLASAMLAFLALGATLLWLPETRRADATRPAEAKKERLRDVLLEPRMTLLLALYFISFLWITNLQVALALLAKERLGWGPDQVGYLFGLFGLCMLVIQGGLIGGLVKRTGEINLMISGTLLVAGGLSMISQTHDPAMLVCGTLLFGSGFGVVSPVLGSLTSKLAGSERQGVILGFGQSAGSLARVIGPMLGGFLFSRVGSSAPFLCGAGLALFAFFVAFTLKRRISEAPS